MVKLTDGVGSPEEGGCWMVAASYYETGEWYDQPACVCPVIRLLCIPLNDWMESDEERERIIGPHLFAPVGTAAGRAMEWRRFWRTLDWMVHDWLPTTLDPRLARLVRDRVPRIDSLQATERAVAILDGMRSDGPTFLGHAAGVLASASISSWPATLASAVVYASRAEHLQLILDLCAMTERKELPSPAHTREETVRALERAHACGAARC